MIWFIVLLLSFIGIIVYERKVKKYNFYSPIVVLVGPLLVMSILSLIISSSIGFVTPDGAVFRIWFIGMISFWIGGCIVGAFRRKNKCANPRNFRFRPSFYRFMNVTCILFLVIMLWSLKGTLGSRSLLMLSDQEFAINGIDAHIGGIIMAYLMFYIVSFWEKWSINKWLAAVFIIIILGLKMLSGVRGNVILPFLGAYIFLAHNGYFRISLKQAVIVMIVVFVLFMTPTLIFNVDSNVDPKYLLQYFYFYAFAGVLGFSGYMARTYVPWEINPDFTNTFWINLWELISGSKHYVSPVNGEFVLVSTSESEYIFTSNVYTLIGELYINSGYLIASLFLITFGAYCYLVFFVAKKNPMLLLWYSFLAASLFLGIFSQYILSPYFYELQFLFIVFYFISRMKLS